MQNLKLGLFKILTERLVYICHDSFDMKYKYNDTCQNLYHTPYQPSTNINTRAVVDRAGIGVSSWYEVWNTYHSLSIIYGLIRSSKKRREHRLDL